MLYEQCFSDVLFLITVPQWLKTRELLVFLCPEKLFRTTFIYLPTYLHTYLSLLNYQHKSLSGLISKAWVGDTETKTVMKMVPPHRMQRGVYRSNCKMVGFQ